MLCKSGILGGDPPKRSGSATYNALICREFQVRLSSKETVILQRPVRAAFALEGQITLNRCQLSSVIVVTPLFFHERVLLIDFISKLPAWDTFRPLSLRLKPSAN